MEAYFQIKRSDRLKFRGADNVVESFLRDRIKFFSPNSTVEFVDEFQNVSNDHEYAILGQTISPLLDFDALERAVHHLSSLPNNTKALKLTGLVPGTSPLLVVNRSRSEERLIDLPQSTIASLAFHTQLRYNSQLNLYKYKRLKVFLSLVKKFSDLSTWSIEAYFERCSNDRELREFLLGYATEAPMRTLEVCPHCSSSDLTELPSNVSQPLIGFLPASALVHQQCNDCGLGFMNPQVDGSHTHLLYDDFDIKDSDPSVDDSSVSYSSVDDGPSTSDTTQIDVPKKVKAAYHLILNRLPADSSVLDIGGGTGRCSAYLKRQKPEFRVVHSDFETRTPESLNTLGVESLSLNFLNTQIETSSFHLITAYEVIEHLSYESFQTLLDNVHQALHPGGYFLFTTPDIDSPLTMAFDFFSAYAPHHLLLFSRSWLRQYFTNNSLFEVVEEGTGADLLDEYESFFQYYVDTAPSFEAQSSAELVKNLLRIPTNHDHLIAEGVGTEVIMVVQKKVTQK